MNVKREIEETIHFADFVATINAHNWTNDKHVRISVEFAREDNYGQRDEPITTLTASGANELEKIVLGLERLSNVIREIEEELMK